MIIEGEVILDFKSNGNYEDFIGILLFNDYEIKTRLSDNHEKIYIHYKKIEEENHEV